MRVDVAAAGDLEEGRPRVVRAQSREVVLTRWRDRVFAVRNICPHQSQSFERALIRDRLSGTQPGEIDTTDDPPILACPWHGWQFDVGSGRCVTDGRYRVRSYPVTVENGRVYVEVGPEPKARAG
jgi:nitrite reductase/ring-hydroxylating ferredoxin subunit